MDLDPAAAPVSHSVHLMSSAGPIRVPIFPLGGALLFPRAQLPLHIFEPRYRAMVRDAMGSDGLIGMIQPKDDAKVPRLFEIGCIGRIIASEELEDGRFNIVLSGLSRFRLLDEVQVSTPYRQGDADRTGFDDDLEPDPLASIQRAELEREAKRYADALGYSVDWDAVGRIDDEMLVNGIAQIAPLDVGSKQALLEADGLARRGRPARPVHAVPAHAAGRRGRPGTLQ
jgi:Lon protease-like protein